MGRIVKKKASSFFHVSLEKLSVDIFAFTRHNQTKITEALYLEGISEITACFILPEKYWTRFFDFLTGFTGFTGSTCVKIL